MTNSQPGMTKLFAERLNWDESERQKTQKAEKFWKYFSFAGWSIGVVGVASVFALLPLKQFVPVVVKVDRTSGEATVNVGKQTLNVNDQENERQMIADVVRYVRAREGFTRGEAETNYRAVWFASDEALRGQWDSEFRADRNPQALIATLSARDQIKLVNLSVSFLPSDLPSLRIAQVRYEKERRVGANAPTTQKMVSTLTFKYDVASIPSTTEGIVLNPLGFTVINYRADKETEEKVIGADRPAPPTGVFPSAPSPGVSASYGAPSPGLDVPALSPAAPVPSNAPTTPAVLAAPGVTASNAAITTEGAKR